MRAKTEKAKRIVMFKAIGEVHVNEVTQDIENGFFVCPSCEVKVYYKRNHFFSLDHERSCEYVQEQFRRKA
ncbi:hypothetical protein ACN5XJ_27005 (plasmid) [Priestia sp. MF3]|uniref:hypothetical protein n=1 Tax=Priestia sp. MF3 TaxID=3404779 RepID=UPI003B9DE6D5